MDLHLLCTAHGVTKETIERYREDDWIGVDYGTVLLLKNNIIPIAAFGDFDSITDEEKQLIDTHIDVEILPTEKNETDLEVGIRYALTLGYQRVYIHGATGGRLDHFLGNLQILLDTDVLLSDSEFSVIDEYNLIHVLATGTHIIQQQPGMKYVSFIPVNDHVILTIEGLKYELPRTEQLLGSTRTISNEFVSERAEVTVENGMVYMIQSKDA